MHIHQEQAAKVLTLTIQRPDRLNALGPSIACELFDILSQLKSQLESNPFFLSALCIRATPTPRQQAQNIWVAGGDLKELASLSREDARLFFSTMNAICNTLESLPIPVVTVIDGAAIGGGAEFALASDWRIANCDASFDFKQLTIGLPTGFGGAQRLTAILGLARAQQLLYGRRCIDAQEAYQLGLIHELCDQRHQLEDVVTSRLMSFSADANEALCAQKALLKAAQFSRPRNTDHADSELDTFMAAWGNAQHRRFMTAFQQRHQGSAQG